MGMKYISPANEENHMKVKMEVLHLFVDRKRFLN